MNGQKKCLDCNSFTKRTRCRKCYEFNRTHGKLWQNKEWLHEQYDKGLSFDSIAKVAGCGHTIIAYWFKKFGLKPRPAPSEGVCTRELNYSWKGGLWKSTRGYKYVHHEKPHAYKTRKYYVAEHILEAEKTLGRKLIKPEMVHHRNGIKDDNRPGNLQVMANESAHHTLEARLGLFAKQITFGELAPDLKPRLQGLLNIFLSKNE
jgi:hypothetical protein